MSVGHLDFRGNCFAENFWGGRPQCCQHVFRIGSSERKHRMHFDDFWSLEAPGVAILLGFDFMVIFNAFKTKVQDRTRPRSQDFWQKMENGLNVFFFERLVSFYHYFDIFPGSKYFAKVPSKKSTQCAPQVSHTSPENWWFPSSVHLLYLWGAGFFRWTNHQTSKVYLLTTATNPSSKFYWQPHLTGRMHPLGCSLTTLVIHFHARHLFFRAFFFGVKLLKGTKRLRIWI